MEIWIVLPIIYIFLTFPIYLMTASTKSLFSKQMSFSAMITDFLIINIASFLIFIPTTMYIREIHGNIVVLLWGLSLFLFFCTVFYKKNCSNGLIRNNIPILFLLQSILQVIIIGLFGGFVILMLDYLNRVFGNG